MLTATGTLVNDEALPREQTLLCRMLLEVQVLPE
jgi:hypothetical protein